MFCRTTRTLSIFLCILSASCADFGGTQNNNNNNSDFDYFPLNYRNFKTTVRPNYIDSNDLESSVSNHKLNDITGNECGGIFRDRQVIIKSPQYPRTYLSNLHCIYTFYSPFVCSNEFHVQFLDFSLEATPNCTKDRMTIGSDEILCGKVIGIMKYHAKNGLLRIVFSSDEGIGDRGFKLLVTRLPCLVSENAVHVSVATTTEEIIEIISPNKDQPTSIDQTFTSVSDWDGIIPSHEFELPKTYRHPIFTTEYQPSTQIPPPLTNNWASISNFAPNNNVLPLVTPFIPPIVARGFAQSPGPLQPFAGYPRCCANSFHQNRFYLVSDGFPHSATQRSDCVYHIQRSNPNICRIRIEFKYFLLSSPQQNSFDCTQNYLEIDGQRICGCKTGMIYISQWGLGDRVLRYVSAVGYQGNQGFILDVAQEPCPFRLSANREINLLLELPHSRFLFATSDANRCFLDYGQWLRLTADQLFLSKPVCIKTIF